MKFYGELLIFVLLLITNARVIIIKKAKRDTLVILAPITLTLAIIQIFSFGVDAYTITGIILALLVFFSNFHALFRYSEQLYVDHYSPLMKFWSAVTIVLSVLVIGAAIFFSPVEYRSAGKKLNLRETTYRYKGSFRTGFESATNFDVTNAQLLVLEKEQETAPENIVLFIPDKRGDTWYYKPYLQQLAASGYTVCSADYFTSDSNWTVAIGNNKLCRRFAMVLSSLANNFKFMSQKEFYAYNITQELKASVQLLSEKYGDNCKFFLVSDVMGNLAAEDFEKTNRERICGKFFIDSIPEYKTPGYGCIAQTDPLLACILGVKKDYEGFYTKYMAMKTDEAIKEVLGEKNDTKEDDTGKDSTGTESAKIDDTKNNDIK